MATPHTRLLEEAGASHKAEGLRLLQARRAREAAGAHEAKREQKRTRVLQAEL